MEIPFQFLQVHYEKNVLPHDWSKVNIQVRKYWSDKLYCLNTGRPLHISHICECAMDRICNAMQMSEFICVDQSQCIIHERLVILFP